MGRHLGLFRRYSFPVELLEKKVSVMPWIHISRTWNHIDTNYYVWPFLPIWALWVSPLLIKKSSNRHWRPFAHSPCVEDIIHFKAPLGLPTGHGGRERVKRDDCVLSFNFCPHQLPSHNAPAPTHYKLSQLKQELHPMWQLNACAVRRGQ